MSFRSTLGERRKPGRDHKAETNSFLLDGQGTGNGGRDTEKQTGNGKRHNILDARSLGTKCARPLFLLV